MDGTVLSLIPPVLTIALILITKRLLMSLSLGIVVGALMFHQGNPLAAVGDIVSMMIGVIQGDGLVLLFVLLVGVLASLLYLSGGIYAFSEWGVTKAKSRVQAQLATMALGLVTWFDDSFSCLFRGTVMRSITDRYRISHSKLSYVIHSTSAPIAMLVPVSVLAIVLTALLGSVLETNGITAYTSLETYLRTIPGNYYTISTLLIVVAVSCFNIDVFQMRRDEDRAIAENVLFDTSRGKVAGQDETTAERHEGKLSDLYLPVLTLMLVTVVFAVWFGISSSDGDLSVLNFLANAEVIKSLVFGGLAANAVAVGLLIRNRGRLPGIGRAALSGFLTTLPSAMILFLALVTAQIIGLLGVGNYLATLVQGNVAVFLLPAIFFVLSAFMSYSIGSTMGTASLMIPIGAEMVMGVDPAFLLPVISACIAGTVFGEHSSPLSDTTILASIGSAVHPIDHIWTQFPYAVLSSVASILGFIVLGLTTNTWLGLLVSLVVSVTGLAVARILLVRGRPRPTFDHDPVPSHHTTTGEDH